MSMNILKLRYRVSVYCGNDRAIYDRIRESLKDGGIPFICIEVPETRKQSHYYTVAGNELFGRNDSSSSSANRYEVLVRRNDEERASEAINNSV